MTAYWIDPKSRAVCICLLISSSVARKVAECGSSTTAPMSLSGKTGVRCRVVVATHATAQKKSRIGHTRKGIVYELFFTRLSQEAFTASDVVALYEALWGL